MVKVKQIEGEEENMPLGTFSRYSDNNVLNRTFLSILYKESKSSEAVCEIDKKKSAALSSLPRPDL